jgi:hypothetical protein
MLGMSLGPITGKPAAQVVFGEKPEMDLCPLRREEVHGLTCSSILLAFSEPSLGKIVAKSSEKLYSRFIKNPT